MHFIYAIDDGFPMSLPFRTESFVHSHTNARNAYVSKLQVAKYAINFCVQSMERRKQVSHVVSCLSRIDTPIAYASPLKSPNSVANLMDRTNFIDICGQPVFHSISMSKLFSFCHTLDINYHLSLLSLGTYLRIYNPLNIIYFTTRQKLKSHNLEKYHGHYADGTVPELQLPGLKAPGCEFFLEPFRFNQRLFVILLESADDVSQDTQPHMGTDNLEHWLLKMTHLTCGQMFVLRSLNDVQECMCQIMGEAKPMRLNQYPALAGYSPLPVFPPSIVGNFKLFDDRVDVSGALVDELSLVTADPMDPGLFSNYIANRTRADIELALTKYGSHIGYWPIPEIFKQVADSGSFFKPKSHPEIMCFMAPETGKKPSEHIFGPSILTQDWTKKLSSKMTFNKYAIDSNCQLAQKLMRGSAKLAICAVCYKNGSIQSFADIMAENSGKFDKKCLKPFGFLKLNSQKNGVNFWVLPWNFPTFFSLLDRFKRVRSKTAPDSLLKKWNEYIDEMPFYYYHPTYFCLNLLQPNHIEMIPKEALLKPPEDENAINFRKLVEKAQKYGNLELKKIMEYLESVSTPKTLLKENSNNLDNILGSMIDNPFNANMLQSHESYEKLLKIFDENSHSSISLGVKRLPQRRNRSDPIQNILRSWNLVPKYGKRITPRTDRQAEADAIHQKPPSVMTDFKSNRKKQKLRFLHVDQEIRHELLGFGNPYSRENAAPGFRRKYALKRRNQNVASDTETDTSSVYSSDGESDSEKNAHDDIYPISPTKSSGTTYSLPNSLSISTSKIEDISEFRFSKQHPLLTPILGLPFDEALLSTRGLNNERSLHKKTYLQDVADSQSTPRTPHKRTFEELYEAEKTQNIAIDEEDMRIRKIRLSADSDKPSESENFYDEILETAKEPSSKKINDATSTKEFKPSDEDSLTVESSVSNEIPENLAQPDLYYQTSNDIELSERADILSLDVATISRSQDILKCLSLPSTAMLIRLSKQLSELDPDYADNIRSHLITRAKKLRRFAAVKYLQENH